MFTRFAPALLLTALASCGAAKEAKQMNENTTVTQFAISSSDIADDQPIGQAYTCDGADRSPQLSWPEAPPGTRSFALIMDDPDAPNGTFRHWAAFNIPPGTRAIAGGQSAGTEAVNDFGKSGYGGPCPPRGHGPHRYRFKLYALDVDRLSLPAEAKVEQVEEQARRHQIAMAQITGTYERK